MILYFESDMINKYALILKSCCCAENGIKENEIPIKKKGLQMDTIKIFIRIHNKNSFAQFLNICLKKVLSLECWMTLLFDLKC